MSIKEDLIQYINSKYQRMEELLKDVAQDCENSLRPMLEACVKLFWLVKYNEIPVWVNKKDQEEFILNEAIKDKRFSKFFSPFIISDMHSIRLLGNKTAHPNAQQLNASEINELVDRLRRIIREMEKVLGLSIIKLIQEEIIPPSAPVSAPVVEKKQRDKVKHSRFGEGEIVSIKGDIIKVIFGVTIKEFPYPSSINNGTLIPIQNPIAQPAISVPKARPSTSSQKHRWTFDEDKTCCRIFIETYITNHTYCPFDSLATKISTIYPNMKFSSIKMKLQNIKRICLDYGIKDSSTISPLNNYSQQNLQAMKEELLAVGIII